VSLELGAWSLELLWSLELGAWGFFWLKQEHEALSISPAPASPFRDSLARDPDEKLAAFELNAVQLL
jgi:hypothetical protein